MRLKADELAKDGPRKLIKLALSGSLKRDEYVQRLELLRGLGEKIPRVG